ncbi:hypothetical protein PV682_43150 [Streptomyces niveiscabiei]|uniref:hypothetical protein n=1 Tax=Streptomyces niveiscabiei TaxID=164115 RepID=UPI0029A4FED9|nr:hypothetical protein [Streptomyces niveiscabiei]MDX3388190.1 hypothetical protein [Streptomyces niveiscabiei]
MASQEGLTQDALLVGLFCVTPDRVYLGAPPGEAGTGIQLSPFGLQPVGSQATPWPWPEVSAVRVVGAPVKSGVARGLAVAGLAASMLLTWWSVRDPDQMLVVLEVADGSSELLVDSAAAIAYTPREAELSQTLLNRFTDGSLSPSIMTEWRSSTPKPRRLAARPREELLLQWTQS